MKNIIKIVLIILVFFSFIPETIKTENNSIVIFTGYYLYIDHGYWNLVTDNHSQTILFPSKDINDISYFKFSLGDFKLDKVLLKNDGILLYHGINAYFAYLCCNYDNITLGMHNLYNDKSKDSLFKSIFTKDEDLNNLFHNTKSTEFLAYDSVCFYEIKIYKIQAELCTCNNKVSPNKSKLSNDSAFYHLNNIISLSPLSSMDSIKFDEIFKNILNYK